jgi:hypothetical protein
LKLQTILLSSSVFLFLFFILPTSLLAQKKGWQDVVYLKNGSILRGELQEGSTEEIIKIEITGRNLFVFRKDEVARVSRELIPSAYKYTFMPGYQNITELGVALGSPSASTFSGRRQVDFSLHTFNGYAFKPGFALGLSTGIDTYSNLTLLPFGTGIRGDLSKTKVRPFYGFDAGYAFDWINTAEWNGELTGGSYWSPAMGLKFSGKEQHAFVMNFGYKNQRTTTRRDTNNTRIEDKRVYHRIFFRLGMSF